MRVYRNRKELARKETLGRRLTLAGMGVLVIGFVASLVPTWYPPTAPIQPGLIGFLQEYWSWISFGALFVGFMCASVGSYYINRFARRRWPGSRLLESPDQVLERSMKGFDDKFAYFVLSLPVGYALAGPNGITIFALRGDRGRVVVEGDKWREPFSFGRLFTFFAREGVGNPAQDINEQKAKLQALLAKAGNGAGGSAADAPGGLASVPIDGAAVFLNPQVQLEVVNPSVPALRPDQVKDYVRARAKEVKLPAGTQRALTDFLVQNAVFQEEESE